MLSPSLGATGLLAGVVIMILRGKLVPRSTLDDLRTDKDSQIATWKAAYETAVAGQDVQREHITALLEANRTTTQVIQSLPKAARGDGREDRHALAEAEE